MKLGRLPVRHDNRTLMASKYMSAVSPPPSSVDWLQGVPSWPMYKNDLLGDCTVAAAAHFIGEWTSDSSHNEALLADPAIVTAYSAVSGYDPNTGANDNGAVELDVLNYWRNTGVGGHRIAAYVSLNVANHDQIKQAINLFGGVYIGVNMPISAQSQVGSIWTVTTGPDSAPGSWGGHAVNVGAYNASGLTCITWGASQRMTWAWWDKYVEEAYAIVSPDFFTGGKDPQGFDMTTLQADLVAVHNNQPTPAPSSPPAPSSIVVTLTDPLLIKRLTAAALTAHQTNEEFVKKLLDTHFHIPYVP